MYAFVEDLYREHAAALTAALALSTGDRGAAEDLAHEVFERAMGREEELRTHPSPRAWLFRTGYNLASNRWKLLARRRHAIAREHPMIPEERWEEMLDLRRSLARLSARQREAVILHHYMGFGVDEVAGMLGCSAGAVKSHLSRGRSNLSQMLAPEEATR